MHTCSVIDRACPLWFVFIFGKVVPPPRSPRSLSSVLSGVAVKVAQQCFSLAKCNWRERSVELWFTGPRNTDTQGYAPLFLHPFISVSSLSAFTSFSFCTAFQLLSSASRGSILTQLKADYLFVWFFFYGCHVVLGLSSEVKPTFARRSTPSNVPPSFYDCAFPRFG